MVKKAVLVLPKWGFDSQTYLIVNGTLDDRGIAVFTGSSTLEACVGQDGLVAKPDLRLVDIKGADWDAIIFLDGPGSSEYWNDSTAHTLCQVAWAADRIVGAVGSAVVTLANSGILADLLVASGPSWADLVSAKGGTVSDRAVEVDGNLVTAADNFAAQAFAATIVDLLTKQ